MLRRLACEGTNVTWSAYDKISDNVSTTGQFLISIISHQKMEKTDKPRNTSSGGFSAGFVVCLVLILFLVAFISYGVVYVTGLSAELKQQNDVIGVIQTELHSLKKVL